MSFELVISLLQEYWGIISTVLGFIVYALFQRENAKKIILSIMLRLEKEAEALALQTGDDKLEFMLEKGYLLLPLNVRLFVPQATFNELAKSLYLKAKSYLIVHQAKEITKEIVDIPVVPVDNVSETTVTNEITPLSVQEIVTQFTIEASQQAVNKVLIDITNAINNSVKVNK